MCIITPALMPGQGRERLDSLSQHRMHLSLIKISVTNVHAFP